MFHYICHMNAESFVGCGEEEEYEKKKNINNTKRKTVLSVYMENGKNLIPNTHIYAHTNTNFTLFLIFFVHSCEPIQIKLKL